MISLTSAEVEKLEIIGSGNFGMVYRCEDRIYKIYNKSVNASENKVVPNPALKYRKRKLNRLISLNKRIENTDLIDDVIFIDGNFSGVSMSYYEGVTLSDLIEEPIEKRITIAKAIVKNAKELTKHFVYPTDYKLNNFMFVDGEVKIIDLDDELTKVKLFPDPLLAYESITCLDDMIKQYFDEYISYFFMGGVEYPNKIRRTYPPLNSTYNGIEEYIESKKIKYNYLFITDKTNVDKYMDLLKSKLYRVVYVYEKRGKAIDFLERMFSLDIDIYDVVYVVNIKRYLNSIMTDECLEVSDNKVFKIEKCKKM